MNSFKSFEKKLREANYASVEQGRAELLKHPLAAEYIVAVLVDRGVLEITADGRLIGSLEERTQKAPREKKGGLAVGEWNPAWAPKNDLMGFLDYSDWDGEGDRFKKFRALQQDMMELGRVHSHWLTLHAVWHLMKEGLVEKAGRGYRLSPHGEAVETARRKAERQVVTDILKRVGHPYDPDAVKAELKKTPGHVYAGLDSEIDALEPRQIEGWVSFKKKNGEL